MIGKRTLLVMIVLTSMMSAMGFEGEIKYRSFRNMSPEVLALQPSVFNGENTCTMIVKGDKMLIQDGRKGTVTVLKDGVMTEYASSDNSGYSCPAPKYNASAFQFPVKETDQTREMLGTTATKYISDKSAAVGMELSGWVIKDDFGLSPAALEVLNAGMNVPGVLTKYTLATSAPYAQFVCNEILSITPREVSDSEFDIIPVNAQLEVVKDWKKYKYHDKKNEAAAKFLKGDMKDAMGMGDLVTNFMKTHPVRPQKVDKTSYDIDEDWDF